MDLFVIRDRLISISHELMGIAQLLSFMNDAETAMYHKELYYLSVLEKLIDTHSNELLSISDQIFTNDKLAP